MKRTSDAPSGAVIDASIAVLAVLPARESPHARELIGDLHREGRLLAPSLWLFEATSALRKQVALEIVAPDEGERAVADLFGLGIEGIPADRGHCRRAFAWADRLRQTRAYDGFYLALAEALGTPFWTIDRRLARSLEQHGVDWVRTL